MSENQNFDPFENMMQAQKVKENIFRKKMKEKTIINGVNVSRMIRDWTEMSDKLKSSRFDIKRERVYTYLVDDISKLPEEIENIDLPNEIVLNVLLFKENFDGGVEDIRRQWKEKSAIDPVISTIIEQIDVLDVTPVDKQMARSALTSNWLRVRNEMLEVDDGDIYVKKVDNRIVLMYKGSTLGAYRVGGE